MTGAWSWWQGGLALAGVSFLHWLWQGRLLAVSGRITALVRRRVTVDDELAAELARATAEAFPDAPPVTPPRPRWDGAEHLLFLVALVAGGAFAQTFVPASAEVEPSWSVLLIGGLLVGAGTRMASGCTSGHGLSGVSRFQPGSLATIAATFAGGIVTTWLLR